jgi:hypothetical protein
MQQYSFLNYVTTINGVPVTGWAEGDDVIQVSRREDAFADNVGADGKMIMYQTANRSGEITFKLQQQGEGNILLNALYAQQEALRGQNAPVTITLTNIADPLDSVLGANCYVTKPADITRGTGVNSQEWTLIAETLVLSYGTRPVGLPAIP